MLSKDNILSSWAAYCKNNDIRYNSSSGGIFSLIAENVINSGGVVYGVAMDEDCYGCSFKRISTIGKLYDLRGSKYIQAKVGDTYKQVRDDLRNGTLVLFSGVGCQINGLNLFLNHHYDNLLCIDVICHGTPSPKIWNMYVRNIESQHGKVKFVSFRNKQNSWEDFGLKEEAGNDSLFYPKNDDTYMRFFLRNYDLRPSCYNCRAKTYKTSDITLADFWGINNVDSSMNDGHGTSFILVRTEKGKAILESIKCNLVLRSVSYEDGVRSNPSEYSSVTKPEQRNTLFTDAAILSYPELIKKYKVDQALKVPFKHRVKMKIKSVIKQFLKRGGYKEHKPELNYGMFFEFENGKSNSSK